MLQGSAVPNGILSGVWNLFSMKTVQKFKQVHFTDGFIWRNSKFQEQVDKEKENFN